MGRLNDDWQITAYALHFFQEFDAVHSRHDQIKDHQFDAAAAWAVQGLQTLAAAINRKRLKTKSLYEFFQNTALGWVIFND